MMMRLGLGRGLGRHTAKPCGAARQQQQTPRPACVGSSTARDSSSSTHVSAAAPSCVQQQQYNVGRRTLTACRSSADDAAATAAAAAAAERRRQRKQRRSARQQGGGDGSCSSGSGSEDDDAHGVAPQQQAGEPQRAVAEQPVSRLAARRQQRAKLRARPQRRVPAALAPSDVGDGVAGDDDEDDDGAADGSARGLSAAVDNTSEFDLSLDDMPYAEDDDDDSGVQQESAAASAVGAQDGEGQEQQQQQQLPQSVLQQAHGARRKQPWQQKQQQQQQQHKQRQEAYVPLEPVQLSEKSPMYLPVLTDEDLAADPPDHKSGYVAVIGRPNAGKSTLINAIVGQKLSIVTFKPQTTRHRVVGIASDTGYQMILFDTPGIMEEQRSKLDERMMAAVVSSIKAAEVIVAVVDSSHDPQDALAMFQPGPDWSGPPMAVLLNKADLLSEEQVQELKEWYTTHCRAEQVFVGSALSGDDAGVQAIKAWAVSKLPEGPTLYPKSMVSEQPERFFVSEIIREAIFLQYKQEIPYACQVQITNFVERPGAKDEIEAIIYVERESQAPILLGKGGAAIKQLSTSARMQIEEFLGRPVYLNMTVQVAPSWRQQPDRLRDYGYFDALYVS